MDFLKSVPARVVTAVLLFQAVAYYAVASREEKIPSIAALATLPTESGGWTVAREMPLEPEVQEILKADDTLNRIYINPAHTAGASLYIAFFKTQRYGQSPHSPKNCLPGSGWQQDEDRRIELAASGRTKPRRINEYIVSRGGDENVVLYWYQSHSRVIAREFEAKFWLVADAIRYHRSDTALIRVMVPVRDNGRASAERTAIQFAQAVYPDIVRQLPQ
jgi:EpsI family protein